MKTIEPTVSRSFDVKKWLEYNQEALEEMVRERMREIMKTVEPTLPTYDEAIAYIKIQEYRHAVKVEELQEQLRRMRARLSTVSRLKTQKQFELTVLDFG